MHITRDMTVFVDGDGKAYHFFSSEDNKTMRNALLSDDYLKHSTTYKRISLRKVLKLQLYLSPKRDIISQLKVLQGGIQIKLIVEVLMKF
jgi:hypothetical protein